MKLETFLYILSLIFVILKVSGSVNWSWWVVLSPFFLHLSMVLFVLLIIGLVGVMAAGIDAIEKHK